MTDTMCELILRVLDYVERTPGAHFEIARWREVIAELDEIHLFFDFCILDERHRTHYISRDGNKYWSQLTALTEDNLRYLVERLEGEK